MMHNKRLVIFLVLVTALFSMASNCRDRGSDIFTIAMDGKFSTLDPIGSVTVDANSERLRTLMYNSLIKKDGKFDYVGDLAKEFTPSEDGLTYTFTLQDNVTFHNGNPLTAADVKYTFDTLFQSEGGKAAAFFETIDGKKTPIITAIKTPDEKTITVKIARAELKNQLLPNLVPIAIIPKDSPVGEGSDAATNPPPGTGAYKFSKFDTAQNVVELEGYDNCWDGAPNINNLRVRIVADSAALQAELRAGKVDLAPGATNLSPDTLKGLDDDPKLKVVEVEGSNIQYLWFNTEASPVNKVKVRQAIAHGVDREKIITDQLNGKATLASSILPEGSWAFSAGTKYNFDVEKSKKLLDEAGFTDKDGDGMREMDTVIFKISSGSKPVIQYSQIIQSQLKEIGIPVDIESLEFQTMLSQVKQGQFKMTTGRWVGGNQDPIFLKDLFASSEIPDEKRASRNRGRYQNKEVDELLEKALKELDKDKAKEYYLKAQGIISEELPLFPLWYPNNLIVAKENVQNINMNASGDWDFVRKMTVE